MKKIIILFITISTISCGKLLGDCYTCTSTITGNDTQECQKTKAQIKKIEREQNCNCTLN